MEDCHRAIDAFASRFQARKVQLIEISKLESVDKENWKDCVKELADKIYSIRESNKMLGDQFAEVEEIVPEGISRQTQFCGSRGRLMTEGQQSKPVWMQKQFQKVQPLFTSRSKNTRKTIIDAGFMMASQKEALAVEKSTTKRSNRHIPVDHRRNKSFVQSIGDFYHKADDMNYDCRVQPIKVEKLTNRNSSIEKEFLSLNHKNPVLAQLLYKNKAANAYPFMKRK